MQREFAAHLKGTLNGQLASERMFRREEGQREGEGAKRGELHQSVPSEKRIKLGQQQTKHLATPSFDLAKWHVCKLSNGAGSVQHKRQPPVPFIYLLPAAQQRHYLIHEVQIGKNVSKENAAKETSARGKRGERREREDRLRKKRVGTDEEGSVKGVWSKALRSVDSRLQRFVWQAARRSEARRALHGVKHAEITGI